MKAAELRQLSEAELNAKVSELQENLFRLRCNKAVGQLEDGSVINKARKDIARTMTVLNDKTKG